MPPLDSFVRDARLAIRDLACERAFAAIVVLMLGVCIGANVAAFSVLNAIVLQPLPSPAHRSRGPGLCRSGLACDAPRSRRITTRGLSLGVRTSRGARRSPRTPLGASRTATITSHDCSHGSHESLYLGGMPFYYGVSSLGRIMVNSAVRCWLGTSHMGLAPVTSPCARPTARSSLISVRHRPISL